MRKPADVLFESDQAHDEIKDPAAVKVRGLLVSEVACSRASRARSVLSEVETRQPTMRRENLSITRATQTNPRHDTTQVKSLIQRRFELGCSEVALDEVHRALARVSGNGRRVASAADNTPKS